LYTLGGVTISKGTFISLIARNQLLHFSVTPGSLVFDILTANDGKTINWYSFEYPVLISMPVTGADFVMKDAKGIIPRSWAKGDTLYGLVYSAGKYEAVAATPLNFTDTSGKWINPVARYLSARGVISGIGDNKFAPEAEISRQDMFLMLYNAMEKLGLITTVADAEIDGILKGFTDAGEISDYARNAMATFVKAGIVNGKGNGVLDPKGTTTRAEAARIIYNMLQRDDTVIPLSASLMLGGMDAYVDKSAVLAIEKALADMGAGEE
jgi:hypothetical protein